MTSFGIDTAGLRSLPALMVAPLVALMVASAANPAEAQVPDPASLYPQQAAVIADHVGLVRLPLSAEVIQECREDLSDLRVFQGNREVQFYVDAEGRATSQRTFLHSLELLEVERVETPVDGGPSRFTERLQVAIPPEANMQERVWRLAFSAGAPRFVRRVVVYAADEDGTLRRELVRGTIFMLPSPRAQSLDLELPATDAARLVIEIEGDGFYLEPALMLGSTATVRDPAVLELPLVERSRETVGSITRVQLVRPTGFVPDRLLVRTQERTFHVGIEARDMGPGGSQAPIGSGAVFRIADLAEVEMLEVPLSQARGDTIELTLEAHDAELPRLEFVARVRQPALIFDHSYGTVLRFGGGRARSPVYGIASVLGQRVLAGQELPAATLGGIESNPGFDPSPALAFAMHPGREVEVRRYAHAQTVTVPQSREGLTRIVPSTATLGAADANLADVRVVDSQGRQFSYVRGQELSQTFTVTPSGTPYEEPDEDEPNFGVTLPASTYTVALPASPLPIRSITVWSDAPYVDRAVKVIGTREEMDDPEVLASGRLLARPNGGRSPVVLEIGWGRLEQLSVIVEDGDDAALAELEIEVQYFTVPLYLTAPEGEYRLLVGVAEPEMPVYELERARELILNVEPVDAVLGPLEDNASYEPPSTYSKELWKDVLMWVVLILGVLVLLVLTLRSARSADFDESKPSGQPATQPGGRPNDGKEEAGPEDGPTQRPPDDALTEEE